MARKATGSVVERRTQEGIVYALRFRALGQRRYVTLGTAAEGYTRKRAEDELERTMAQVRLGIWRPDDEAAADPKPAELRDPTFHEYASEWFELERYRKGWAAKTITGYTYHLSHQLLPFFGPKRLSEITPKMIDTYTAAMRRAREDGRHNMSDRTLNDGLTRLAQILEAAVEDEEIALDRNPASSRKRRIRTGKPKRALLDRASQLEALLEAAKQVDRNPRLRKRRGLPRAYTMVLVLAFTGLRLSEFLALEWRDIDLANRRLIVRESKTDAGRLRYIGLFPLVLDALAEYKAWFPNARPTDLVWPSRAGTQMLQSNFRTRIYGPVVRTANATLAAVGEPPLPEHLSPHGMRRTFASVMYALRYPETTTMASLGHASSALTLEVYARPIDEVDRKRIARLVGVDAPTPWSEPMGTTNPLSAQMAPEPAESSLIPDFAPDAPESEIR
jgi:integrase